MSAYIVVELSVKDAAAKERYSASAGPIIKEYGGESIVGGKWAALACHMAPSSVFRTGQAR